MSKNEKIKEVTCEVVDDLSGELKKSSKKLSDVMVERSLEILSENFDYIISKLKNKIKGV